MSIYDYLHPLWKKTLSFDENNNKQTVNNAFLDTLNTTLSDTETEAVQAKAQSYLNTATGSWLDSWGKWFGYFRKSNLDDDSYRQEIKDYVLTERNTVPAIKKAIGNFLDLPLEDISIYEPWRNIFVLNDSQLNGKDHLMGGYYSPAIIDIHIGEPFDTGLIDVINSVRPAGVIWVLTYDSGLAPSSDTDTGVVDMSPVGLEIEPTQELIAEYSGFDSEVRRVLKATYGSIAPLPNLFTTNTATSKLNDTDVLAGNAHGGSQYYNSVGISTTIPDGTTIETPVELQKQTTPLETYELATLSNIDGNTYKLKINKDTNQTYLTFAYDLRNFFYDNYISLANSSKYINNNNPTILSLINNYLDKVSLEVAFKTSLPIGVTNGVSIKLFNYKLGLWVDFKSVTLNKTQQLLEVDLSNKVENYLSDTGTILFSLAFTNSTVDYNAYVDVARIQTMKHLDETSINIFGDYQDSTEGTTYQLTLVDTTFGYNEMQAQAPRGRAFKYLRAYVAPNQSNVHFSVLGARTTDSTLPNVLANITNNNDFSHPNTYNWVGDSDTTIAVNDNQQTVITLSPKGYFALGLGGLRANRSYRSYISIKADTKVTLTTKLLVTNEDYTASPIDLYNIVLQGSVVDTARFNLGVFNTLGITPDGGSTITWTNPLDTTITVTIDYVNVIPDMKIILDDTTSYDLPPYRTRTGYNVIPISDTTKEHKLDIILDTETTDITALTAHFGTDVTNSTQTIDFALQYSLDGNTWTTLYDSYKGLKETLDESYVQTSGVDKVFDIGDYDRFNSRLIDDNAETLGTLPDSVIKTKTTKDIKATIPDNLLEIGNDSVRSLSSGTNYTLYPISKTMSLASANLNSRNFFRDGDIVVNTSTDTTSSNYNIELVKSASLLSNSNITLSMAVNVSEVLTISSNIDNKVILSIVLEDTTGVLHTYNLTKTFAVGDTYSDTLSEIFSTQGINFKGTKVISGQAAIQGFSATTATLSNFQLELGTSVTTFESNPSDFKLNNKGMLTFDVNMTNPKLLTYSDIIKEGDSYQDIVATTDNYTIVGADADLTSDPFTSNFYLALAGTPNVILYEDAQSLNLTYADFANKTYSSVGADKTLEDVVNAYSPISRTYKALSGRNRYEMVVNMDLLESYDNPQLNLVTDNQYAQYNVYNARLTQGINVRDF